MADEQYADLCICVLVRRNTLADGATSIGRQCNATDGEVAVDPQGQRTREFDFGHRDLLRDDAPVIAAFHAADYRMTATVSGLV